MHHQPPKLRKPPRKLSAKTQKTSRGNHQPKLRKQAPKETINHQNSGNSQGNHQPPKLRKPTKETVSQNLENQHRKPLAKNSGNRHQRKPLTTKTQETAKGITSHPNSGNQPRKLSANPSYRKPAQETTGQNSGNRHQRKPPTKKTKKPPKETTSQNTEEITSQNQPRKPSATKTQEITLGNNQPQNFE